MNKNIIKVSLLFCLYGCNVMKVKYPPEVALLDRPSISPSGEYTLILEKKQLANQIRFVIQNTKSETIYVCKDWYESRHTFFALWDKLNRVWVYSSDVGTFYWENNNDRWLKNVYINGTAVAPEFLKNIRPKEHKQ